jgi:hypothetical protein
MHNFCFNSSIKIIDDIRQVAGSDITESGNAAVYLVCFKNQA